MFSCTAFCSTVQKHPCINKSKNEKHMKIKNVQINRNKLKHFPYKLATKKTPSPQSHPTVCKQKRTKTEKRK